MIRITMAKIMVEIFSRIFGMRLNYELWKARRALVRIADRNCDIASKM